MIASQFSLKELKIALPVLIEKGKGLIAHTSMDIFQGYVTLFNSELSLDTEIKIESADEMHGDVSINFSQEFHLDEESTEVFYYETIQSVEDIKEALKNA